MDTEQPQGVNYAAVLADLEKKRAIIDQAIAGIRVLIGDVDAAITNPAGSGVAEPPGNKPEVLDEHAFFGMSMSAAAQKYLTIKKKPASAAEMAEALENGGFPSQSDKLGNNITTALYRSKDTFVRVKRGLWGLKAWYPNYRPKDDKGDE